MVQGQDGAGVLSNLGVVPRLARRDGEVISVPRAKEGVSRWWVSVSDGIEKELLCLLEVPVHQNLPANGRGLSHKVVVASIGCEITATVSVGGDSIGIHLSTYEDASLRGWPR